jgi:hypothetical protein
MKNLFMTLAFAIATLPVFANEPEVNQKALDAFRVEFNGASNVKWTISTDYFMASFIYNDKHVFAYYDINGEWLGTTRYVALSDLPLMLQGEVKNKFSAYWITELIEVANNDGTAYYATVENAETRLVLKASDGKTWNHYKKYKKS